MKLCDLNLGYRQFVDECLKLEPNDTAIVRRNDTGKTGIVDQFFHRSIYESVIAGGDRLMVLGSHGTSTRYSMPTKEETNKADR